MKFSSVLAALFAAQADAATPNCECNHSISSKCKIESKGGQKYVKYLNKHLADRLAHPFILKSQSFCELECNKYSKCLSFSFSSLTATCWLNKEGKSHATGGNLYT